MVALLVFIIATLKFLAEKNCWTQKVHLAITLSKTPAGIHLVHTAESQNMKRDPWKF